VPSPAVPYCCWQPHSPPAGAGSVLSCSGLGSVPAMCHHHQSRRDPSHSYGHFGGSELSMEHPSTEAAQAEVGQGHQLLQAGAGPDAVLCILLGRVQDTVHSHPYCRSVKVGLWCGPVPPSETAKPAGCSLHCQEVCASLPHCCVSPWDQHHCCLHSHSNRQPRPRLGPQ